MQELAATTVVLADDHAIVREGIAALCTANGLRVLGQVSDGSAAIEMITALNPDFAILDLHMPVLTGVEAIRRLRAAAAPPVDDPLHQPRGRHRHGSLARADAYPPQRRSFPAFAGRHQLRARRGRLVSPMLRGAGSSPRRRGPFRGPTGCPKSPGNGGLLLSGERTPRQGYRRSAGDQPQDGGHVPGQPDAQTQRSRSGRTGKVRDRAEPHLDIPQR